FGFKAVQDKVHVHDLHATVLHLLGLDHERLTFRHAGRDSRLTDVHGRVVSAIIVSPRAPLSIQLAAVLTPESHETPRLPAQSAGTDVAARYPGPEPGALARQQQRFADFGLRLSVVEGYLPIERIKTGTDDGLELQAMKTLVHQMGQLQIPILCY